MVIPIFHYVVQTNLGYCPRSGHSIKDLLDISNSVTVDASKRQRLSMSGMFNKFRLLRQRLFPLTSAGQAGRTERTLST